MLDFQTMESDVASSQGIHIPHRLVLDIPPLFERCFPYLLSPHGCLDFLHKTALVCSLQYQVPHYTEYFSQLHLPEAHLRRHQNCNVHRYFPSQT